MPPSCRICASVPLRVKARHYMPPTMKSFLLSDWAPSIERTARALAVAIAATFAAGYAAGRMLHRWNDALANLATGRPVAVAPVMIRQAQAAAIAQPAAIAAPPVASLTVAELRKLARAAGHRQLARNGRRADLLAVLA